MTTDNDALGDGLTWRDLVVHEGWLKGVADAIKAVKARKAHYELYREKEPSDDLVLAHIAMRTHPATFAVLDELLVMLEAMHERGTYKATSDHLEEE